MSAIMASITVTLHLKDYIFVIPYSIVVLIFYGGGPAGVAPSLTNEIFIQSYRPAAFVFTGILRWLGFVMLRFILHFFTAALKSLSFSVLLHLSNSCALSSSFPKRKAKLPLRFPESLRTSEHVDPPKKMSDS
ncbi:solute carrier family 2, facilitated glucose transporter member 9-like isoform X1 [Myxocyprinus asiaticus]|uniref:solute carrier family 2, facilitated glucose transporter member 9-like isoform X1 n=1 Tax=Myxocyprinus asiaticus TaxID=70543 RepID=UPI002221C454|nr:solute carrier family 2, facilitated glucose transporter member 9-like isoform X1 [Myxocyprinus asiaticus]